MHQKSAISWRRSRLCASEARMALAPPPWLVAPSIYRERWRRSLPNWLTLTHYARYHWAGTGGGASWLRYRPIPASTCPTQPKLLSCW